MSDERRDTAKSAATAERLRAEIDAGRTHDKISVSDPAAAPLGTDEEAGGIRIDPMLVGKARDLETRPPVECAGGYQDARPGNAAWVLWIALVAALILAGIAFILAD